VNSASSIDAPFPADTGREGGSGAILRTEGAILRTEGLTVRFGGLTAVDAIDFSIARGEVRAIIGPNGAGKSTFFNCLTGVLRPTAGRILFNGEEITGLPPNQISQKGIARSYQITNILPNATVLENVRIAAQSRRHGWNMFRHHSALRDIIEKAEAVLASVGLAAKAEELAANLSHGEQRNLEIGIALATEPQLLCLDEPTAGMSAAETHETIALVRRIAKDLTILIVEHDMHVVLELAQRISVFHYGRVLAEGTPEEIQQNPRVLEVYLKT
jgi:branched-chain amino acid transport system ATP-binding protein